MAGEYVAPNLDPDTYSVRVEAKGFRTFTGEGMQLGVGRDARADVTLQPGEQTQAITVTEALPLIETTTATLTSTVDNPTVSEIPLNGRNYINLLTLRPGSSRPLHRATPVACSLSNTIRFSALPRRFVEIRSNKNLFARKKMRNRSPLEVIQLPEELVRTTVSRWNGVLVRDGP